MDDASPGGDVDEDELAFGSPGESCGACDDTDKEAECLSASQALPWGEDASHELAAGRRGVAASWRRRRGDDPAHKESSLTPAEDEFAFGSGTPSPPSCAALGREPSLSAPPLPSGNTAAQECKDGNCAGCVRHPTAVPAFAFAVDVLQTPAVVSTGARGEPVRSADSSSFAFGTGAGEGAKWSLADRACPSLLSPPPALSNEDEPFCLEVESSTLLSIMDELENADEEADEALYNQSIAGECADKTAAILREMPMSADSAAAIAAALVTLEVEQQLLQEQEDDPSDLPAEEEEALCACGHTPQRTSQDQIPVAAVTSEDLMPVAAVTFEAEACDIGGGPVPSLTNRYATFRCSCAGGCCLDKLSGEELKAACASTHPQGQATSPHTVFERLHGLLWNMKEQLPSPNARGHSNKVKDWSYNKKPLCRKGWQTLMNGTAWCHRQALASVLRGVSPHDSATKRGVQLMIHTETRVEAEASEKRRLTVDWLHRKYLSTMEYMPNENRIVLRGMGTTMVHKEQYTTAARKGGFYLSYKGFMGCMKAAAVACVEEEHGKTRDDAEKVRTSRSARHSKFPMCTSCDVLSRDYISEASNPLADPVVVAEKLQKLLAHQKQFMADRTTARRLRYASYDPQGHHLYECDDKCGSFWCKIPVACGGRSNKGNSKQVYKLP